MQSKMKWFAGLGALAAVTLATVPAHAQHYRYGPGYVGTYALGAALLGLGAGLAYVPPVYAPHPPPVYYTAPPVVYGPPAVVYYR